MHNTYHGDAEARRHGGMGYQITRSPDHQITQLGDEVFA